MDSVDINDLGLDLYDETEMSFGWDELSTINNSASHIKNVTMMQFLRSPHESLRDEFEWHTEGGDTILLRNIADSHLRNCIPFMERQEYTPQNEAVINVLKNEVEFRKELPEG